MPFGPRGSPVDEGEIFYACPACASTFTDKDKYLKHLKNKHRLDIPIE